MVITQLLRFSAVLCFSLQAHADTATPTTQPSPSTSSQENDSNQVVMLGTSVIAGTSLASFSTLISLLASGVHHDRKARELAEYLRRNGLIAETQIDKDTNAHKFWSQLSDVQQGITHYRTTVPGISASTVLGDYLVGWPKHSELLKEIQAHLNNATFSGPTPTIPTHQEFHRRINEAKRQIESYRKDKLIKLHSKLLTFQPY